MLTCGLAGAQQVEGGRFTQKNTFTVFGEYSNDSSHIILGVTPNRKLAGLGVQYERRLLNRRFVALGYEAEFRPFIVSSDPVANTTAQVIFSGQAPSQPVRFSSVVFRCVAGTSDSIVIDPIQGEYQVVSQTTCSRRNTLAQGGSPIGLRIHLLPKRRLQLTLSSKGGYMFSTQPIPIPGAGSFNFTFNFGGGGEYFIAPHRSVRLEYLVQHYSNHNTANDNPGVDSGFARLAYAF